MGGLSSPLSTLGAGLLGRLGPFSISTRSLRLSQLLPTASITIPAINLSIPDVISNVWEGILRAVPKKKTSYSKKRSRMLAGKALKDVQAVVKCPGCGRPKKSHTLCPFCVADIKESWRNLPVQLANQAAQQAKQAKK